MAGVLTINRPDYKTHLPWVDIKVLNEFQTSRDRDTTEKINQGLLRLIDSIIDEYWLVNDDLLTTEFSDLQDRAVSHL